MKSQYCLFNIETRSKTFLDIIGILKPNQKQTDVNSYSERSIAAAKKSHKYALTLDSSEMVKIGKKSYKAINIRTVPLSYLEFLSSGTTRNKKGKLLKEYQMDMFEFS